MVDQNLVREFAVDDDELDSILQGMEEGTLEKTLEEEAKTYDINDIIEGTVVRVDDEEVVVDIGYKSEGVVQRDESMGEARREEGAGRRCAAAARRDGARAARKARAHPAGVLHQLRLFGNLPLPHRVTVWWRGLFMWQRSVFAYKYSYSDLFLFVKGHCNIRTHTSHEGCHIS